jgi:hypothetical protein
MWVIEKIAGEWNVAVFIQIHKRGAQDIRKNYGGYPFC